MNIRKVFLIGVYVSLLCVGVYSQAPLPAKKTVTKTDRFEFRPGGTLELRGAPVGSVRVIGWENAEIEITADIELQAANENDLIKLSEVTGFITEESAGRTGVITIGTHNKMGMKSLPKKFPKHLLDLPFKVDYVISVPKYTDVEIDGGVGDLWISGVEGALRVNFLESAARLDVIGGSVSATLGTGTLDVALGVKGWRARAANIQIASGDLTVRLPSNTSAEIDAVILKNGAIENTFPGLKPRDRKVAFTDKSISAKVGVGGVPLKFTVGDGHLKMLPL